MIIKRQTYNDLMYMAFYDSATGFYNRNWFTKNYLKSKTDKLLNLAMVDVNNLKTTNDELGHDAGDKLIQRVGKTLSNFGTLIRYGGDEFFLLVDDAKRDAFVEHSKNQTDYAYSYKFGFNGLDIEEVICSLDKAMYECKYIQKNNKTDS